MFAPFLAAFALAAGPFTDYRDEVPGRVHHITVDDLPEPYSSPDVANGPSLVPRPAGAWPQAPAGFKVEKYAEGFDQNRLLRTAPNGDLFLAESRPGRIRVLRGVRKDGRAEVNAVFAEGLNQPFGIAFYPPGPQPRWVYVANTGSVVRFPYNNGDLKAEGQAQIVVPRIPSGGHLFGGGHWTRDLAFSKDGKRLFISVGSKTNDAGSDAELPAEEKLRADILVCTPEGKGLKVFASGLRNAVGIAIDPDSGELWASVNERDRLGDNLPPDYITRVQEGGFYGWPWFYIGGHVDPRHKGQQPGLRDKVLVPDVLLQPHNASLELAFYEADAFPEKYRGGIFAAEHGSWNRAARTGYEVIYVPFRDGKATGVYEDFLTGFVTPEGRVWGRPVGIAVLGDGSLAVSDDGGEAVWRVTYRTPDP